MDKEKVLGMIDHTLLKAVSTWPEIESLCDEAVKYHTASVCVPPCFIKRIHDQYGDALAICTVIGFPLGYNTTEIKVAETRQAIADGAVEVDMVVNLGDVKSGAFDKVTEEIRAVKQAAGSRSLKVIIETCYLTEEEKIALCRCVTEAGADYIKTSTGFGTAGAQLEDIALFRKHIGPKVKIKAAGGIRSPDLVEAGVKAGCERIGTRSAVKLLC